MDFDRQPILKGQLLTLQPLRANDYEALYAVAADPLIWEQHPVKDRYKEDVFAVFFKGALASGGTLVAVENATGSIMGSSRFHGYNAEQSEIEIGWTFLARSYWGGRYNGELKRLMLNHAFQFIKHVVLLVGPHNIRSQKAVEKIGGIRVGIRPDGGGRNSIMYQISSSSGL